MRIRRPGLVALTATVALLLPSTAAEARPSSRARKARTGAAAPDAAAQTVTLINTGSAPLTIGAVSFAGANTADFTAALDPGSPTLGPGESRTIDITVPSSGSAEYHCKFHQGQGMQGGIAVT